MLKYAALILALSLAGYWYFQQPTVGEDEIYVDRLVYRKGSGALFTGTVEIKGKSSYAYKRYCQGIPCGEWSEHQRGGGIIQKGTYLDKENLSRETRDLIGTDTFIINHLQEGEGPDVPYPPDFVVYILKDDSFFELDPRRNALYAERLAREVWHDTRHIRYDRLSIAFGDAMRDWKRHYARHYEVADDSLREVYR